MIDDNGVVRKASLGHEWYKYEDRLWANAVILLDSSIMYADGETIPEANIESYFVWIPRYRYKIFNEGNYSDKTGTLIGNKLASKVQEIEVVFENKNTNVSKGSTDNASTLKNINEPGSVQIKPNVYSWRSIQPANAFFSSYDYKRDMDSHMMKNTEWGL